MMSTLKGAVHNRELSIGTDESYSADKTLELFSYFSNSDKLISLYNEIKEGVSAEARFVNMITKLESDVQAKYHEKNGEFTLENAKNDIEKYPEELKSKLTNISNASDGWLAYDAQFYDDFFKVLSDIIKEI